jgi:hypothetical protein
MAKAACSGLTGLFFSDDADDVVAAADICTGCSVVGRVRRMAGPREPALRSVEWRASKAEGLRPQSRSTGPQASRVDRGLEALKDLRLLGCELLFGHNTGVSQRSELLQLRKMVRRGGSARR